MAALSEAYPIPNKDAATFERTENPQTYSRFDGEVEHVKAGRHVLGLVGGNEVSLTKSNWPDVESDLKGITRPNTDCPSRQHLPPYGTTIERNNPKTKLTLDVTMQHLPAVQFWAYPSVIGPEPLIKETCGRPEKY